MNSIACIGLVGFLLRARALWKGNKLPAKRSDSLGSALPPLMLKPQARQYMKWRRLS
jgi:hypothetical protein